MYFSDEDIDMPAITALSLDCSTCPMQFGGPRPRSSPGACYADCCSRSAAERPPPRSCQPHMGPVAHALYAIEALLHMNGNIHSNNELIAAIQLTEEAHVNTAIYNELRSQFNATLSSLVTTRSSRHTATAAASRALLSSGEYAAPKPGLPQRLHAHLASALSFGYASAPGTSIVGPTGGRASTPCSVASVASGSTITASFSGHPSVQASPTPHTGVKQLFGSSRNAEMIDEDEEEILEALDR